MNYDEIKNIFITECTDNELKKCTIPVNRSMKRGILCMLKLEGLLGGHSETDIHKVHTNANILMGRFLLYLKESLSYGLLELSGGIKENVISKESSASIIVSEDHINILEKSIKSFQKIMEIEYGTSNPDIKLTLAVDDMEDEIELVLDNDSLDRVLTLLILMPNNTPTMHTGLPELMKSFINNNIMILENESFQIQLSIQSSVESIKEFISAQVRHLTEMMGGSITSLDDYFA